MLARERNKQIAVEAMEQVVAGHEDDPNALFAFAHLLARAEQYERALEVLDKVTTLRPGDASAVMFQARVMQQQGQTEAALDKLAGYLEQHPDDASARTTYARLLVDAKRYDEAREQFERLAADDADNGEVRYALGLLLLQTNRIDDAQKTFEALVGDQQRRDAAHFYLGQIAESRKQSEEAIGHYRRVYDGEHRFNAQLRVAVLTAMEGDVEEARSYLHAISPANSQEGIKITRAEADILARHDRLEDAMAVYDAAIEQHPTSSDLLYARALLAERLDQLDVVERDLKAIIAREPNNADALNALGYTLADRTDRYEDALGYIERALALKPEDHYIIDSMGWVLYRLGRLQEAIDYLRRAMELSGDPEVAAHLGEALWVAGDKQGAREIWEAALRTTPDDARILEVLKRFGEPTP
ncbi:MAG: tetratricopeptide repeat protein [Planctomycetes bacterium]|nr:tetratricopeptide repeat protein [Planctomycetota bacterium]